MCETLILHHIFFPFFFFFLFSTSTFLCISMGYFSVYFFYRGCFMLLFFLAQQTHTKVHDKSTTKSCGHRVANLFIARPLRRAETGERRGQTVMKPIFSSQQCISIQFLLYIYGYIITIIRISIFFYEAIFSMKH